MLERSLEMAVLGDSVTREWFTYGPLDELLRVEREISLGETAVETYAYDPNRNLIGVTNPEGELTEIAYDERDLAIQIERGRPGRERPEHGSLHRSEVGRPPPVGRGLDVGRSANRGRPEREQTPHRVVVDEVDGPVRPNPDEHAGCSARPSGSTPRSARPRA